MVCLPLKWLSSLDLLSPKGAPRSWKGRTSDPIARTRQATSSVEQDNNQHFDMNSPGEFWAKSDRFCNISSPILHGC